MNNKAIRSPFFYVGDKYKLVPQLRKLFPKRISTYIEPFAGGGSSFLNTKADKYLVNDIDFYIIQLHKYLSQYAGNSSSLLDLLYKTINHYGLSCSFRNITVPDELKKKYVKTYYSHYNKEAYTHLKNDFNNNKNNLILLYLLLIYGFNHMIRFNNAGNFNLPVGNVDFNKNVYTSIIHYLSFMENNDISFYNMDFAEFLDQITFDTDSYVYLDPPYLISGSEYNKLWNEEHEKRLCSCLDELNKKGVRFGITNLINHKGKTNTTFIEWSKKYYIYDINSNYISFNDNTIKENSKEVFITNYGYTES